MIFMKRENGIMCKFRKIVVNNLEYKWLYRYDDYDYQNDPYLLIVPGAFPETTLRIHFSVKEHFLLNSGFPAFFQGKPVCINLNRPFFVSQIIQWCGEREDLFNRTGERHLQGLDILREIGYKL